MLTVQLLEHCTANLQVVGSNPAQTCVCRLRFHKESSLSHMSPGMTIVKAKQLNNNNDNQFIYSTGGAPLWSNWQSIGLQVLL